MDSFRVVQARPENAEEVGRIHALSWKAAYCDILSPTDWLGFTPEKRAAVFRRNYQQTPDQTYLFYAAGEAKGMAILGPSWEEEYPTDIRFQMASALESQGKTEASGMR